MNINYQLVESVKRHQIWNPGNFTKPLALNVLIQTQSYIKLLPWTPKNIKLKRTVVKSSTRTIKTRHGTISCN